MPGDDHHPGFIAVLLMDDLYRLIGHQCGLVALRLNFFTSVRIECEAVAHMLIDSTPDMPILKTLTMWPCRNKRAVMSWAGEMPLPYVRGTIAGFAEDMSNGFELGA
jgi:hypothetical protein